MHAIVAVGDLLEEWFVEFRPDQFGFVALIDQIHVDDYHPATVCVILLCGVDLDPHLLVIDGDGALLEVHITFGNLGRRDAHLLRQDSVVFVGDVAGRLDDFYGFDIHTAAVVQRIGALGIAQDAGKGQHHD